MDYMKRYEAWAQSSFFDIETKAELALLQGNHAEIKERFHKDLEFGTGGLRGIMGAGTNRMNIYTVRKASQGFANFLKKEFRGDELGVLIAYDSRKFSDQFAIEAALVMCANGIKAYVFDSLRPTPELSFGVRYLGLSGGIVITASHNPPEYSGLKVYGSDGAQVTYPSDKLVIEEVNKIDDWAKIKTMAIQEAVGGGMLIYVGKEIDEPYYAAVLAESVDNTVLKQSNNINIVFTPLHGSGNIPVREVLSRAGFENVHIVREQEKPDCNFSTLDSPNPEDSRVFEMALMLAEKVQADIIIGTDPDADRIGVVVRDKFGKYIFLNGNMLGVLLTEYILLTLKKKGRLPEDGVIISSVVSTDLTHKISKHYGVKYIEVLTGFKYVGEKITQLETQGSGKYLFGFEESYGYLAGTYARDKDAVSTAYLVCEMAAAYKMHGMTLCDALTKIYEKYDYHMENTKSITLKGIEGSILMKKIMESYRVEPPTNLGEHRVVNVFDFSIGKCIDLVSRQAEVIDLPKSNVLYYQAEGGSWMCIRPSGTEPKMKMYFGTNAKTLGECAKNIKIMMEEAQASFWARKNAYE